MAVYPALFLFYLSVCRSVGLSVCLSFFCYFDELATLLLGYNLPCRSIIMYANAFCCSLPLCVFCLEQQPKDFAVCMVCFVCMIGRSDDRSLIDVLISLVQLSDLHGLLYSLSVFYFSTFQDNKHEIVVAWRAA